MQDSTRIVVFGSSRCHEGDELWSLAHEVGRGLGSRGLTIISGGYEGTMGAVSRGAREAGGRVVGITTTAFQERTANRFLHEERSERTYAGRMAALLEAGDGYVALPGALGTLAEWLTAWCLASIHQLSGPLWVFRTPWHAIAQAAFELPELAPAHRDLIGWVDDPADLEAAIDRWLGRPDGPVV